MNDRERVRVKRERNFSAHHIFIGAARVAIEDAKAKKPGWFYSQLTAMVMCALAVEALANAFGKRMLIDWQDFESSSPIAKLRLVCKELGLVFDEKNEPWATIRWLSKFRNLVAHAKPELVTEDYISTRDEYEKDRMKMPKSKLEAQVTLGNAQRAYRGVDKVKELLSQKVPPDESFGLYSDSCLGSVSIPHT
jgi:hypothetical protein